PRLPGTAPGAARRQTCPRCRRLGRRQLTRYSRAAALVATSAGGTADGTGKHERQVPQAARLVLETTSSGTRTQPSRPPRVSASGRQSVPASLDRAPLLSPAAAAGYNGGVPTTPARTERDHAARAGGAKPGPHRGRARRTAARLLRLDRRDRRRQVAA